MPSCPKCGKEVLPEANFCPNCGAILPMKPTPQVKEKKKSSKPIYVVALVLIIVVSGLGIYLSRPPPKLSKDIFEHDFQSPTVVVVEIRCTTLSPSIEWYNGHWSGVIGVSGQSSSIEGFGNKNYTFYRSSTFDNEIVTAVIQKQGSGYWHLGVTIITDDGRWLAMEGTEAQYGIVTVSWMG